MKRIYGIPLAMAGVLAWSGAAAAFAPAVPNPSFEKGGQTPEGWTPRGARCVWLEGDAADGRRAAAVYGDGTDSGGWLSAPIDFTPGAVYRLCFMAKSLGAQGGTPTVGPLFCNRDLGGAVTDQWREFCSVFVAPAAIEPDQARLRFGQWKVKGGTAYDRIRLCRADPVHARSADGKLVLGEGEVLFGNEYAFRAPLGEKCGNFSRPLVQCRCGFNTDRWVFSPGDEVVYRHEAGDRRQLRASVDVSVSWYSGGELAVEASRDGRRWTLLGKLRGRGGLSKAIPESLLPARTVYVRLRALTAAEAGAGFRSGSFQVRSYGYEAKVDGPPERLIGRTLFAAVENEDPDLEVSVKEIAPALPGADNRFVLVARRRSGEEMLRPEVRVIGASGARVFRAPPCRVGTDPVRLSLRWALPGAGDWRVVAALGNRRGARAEAAVYAPFLYSAGYGERLPASDAAADLWWASSGWKIPPERPAPRREGRALRISLARNEAEAVQLVVRPKRELEGFVAEVAGPAVGPQGAKIPTEAIEILRERYVFVRRPTDRIGWAGEWPDPLPPLRGSLRLAPGRNQPLWIRVTAPRGIPAGEYLARIRLRARDWSRSAPLRIRVYDFDLPDRMTCSTAFGFSPGNVWRYQKLTDETLRRKVLKLYLDDFAAHHISPYDPAPLDPFRVRWPKRDKTSGKPPTREDLTPSIDWSAWDRAMEEAIDRRGFNSFRLPIVGMGGGTFHSRREPSLLGYPETAPEYRIAFNAYCRQVQEHLRAKGWLDEAYVYWFDEPDPKDYAFVMNGFRKLKAAAPDLRRMLTEEVEPELIGGPNIWCPLTPRFDPAKAAERRKFGEQFWWYICTGPKAPYCGLFIDHPGTELRVWLWQTWKRRIDGILIWQTTYWTSSAAYPDPKRPQNPYEDPMSWVSGYSTPAGTKRPWGNGDGRFLYPPEAAADGRPEKPVVEGPVDSIRWEMLRDGIEDYEYCAILERLVREKAGRLSPTERDRFARLLDAPPEITSSLTSFTRDPAPIEQRRDRLAKAIERLRRL